MLCLQSRVSRWSQISCFQEANVVIAGDTTGATTRDAFHHAHATVRLLGPWEAHAHVALSAIVSFCFKATALKQCTLYKNKCNYTCLRGTSSVQRFEKLPASQTLVQDLHFADAKRKMCLAPNSVLCRPVSPQAQESILARVTPPTKCWRRKRKRAILRLCHLITLY